MPWPLPRLINLEFIYSPILLVLRASSSRRVHEPRFLFLGRFLDTFIGLTRLPCVIKLVRFDR